MYAIRSYYDINYSYSISKFLDSTPDLYMGIGEVIYGGGIVLAVFFEFGFIDQS